MNLETTEYTFLKTLTINVIGFTYTDHLGTTNNTTEPLKTSKIQETTKTTMNLYRGSLIQHLWLLF